MRRKLDRKETRDLFVRDFLETVLPDSDERILGIICNKLRLNNAIELRKFENNARTTHVRIWTIQTNLIAIVRRVITVAASGAN